MHFISPRQRNNAFVDARRFVQGRHHDRERNSWKMARPLLWCSHKLSINLTVHFFSPSDKSGRIAVVGLPWGSGMYEGKFWFRDVDSNHDTQLQRLMSYRLDDPGSAPRMLAEPRHSAQVSLPTRRNSTCSSHSI